MVLRATAQSKARSLATAQAVAKEFRFWYACPFLVLRATARSKERFFARARAVAKDFRFATLGFVGVACYSGEQSEILIYSERCS